MYPEKKVELVHFQITKKCNGWHDCIEISKE